MRTNSFTGMPIGAKTFKSVIALMQLNDLIELQRGGNLKNDFYEQGSGSSPYHPGLATRFRATNAFKALAIDYGFTEETYDKHFFQLKPQQLISLRRSSKRTGAQKTKTMQMKFEETDDTVSLRREVSMINNYLFKQRIEGGVFTGFHRIFNEGDRHDFNWNMGGRLYCFGDESYQTMKKADRLNMKINGSSVAEVDINGSWLTILHAMLNEPLPKRKDLYNITKYDRAIVKGWITATLGFDKFHTRWPQRMKKSLVDDGVRITRRMTMPVIGDAVITKYPLLADWPSCGVRWSKLMYEESRCLTLAIIALRERHNVPALPVHDSLIVPVRAIAKTKAILEEAYQWRLGVKCRLSVSRKGS